MDLTGDNGQERRDLELLVSERLLTLHHLDLKISTPSVNSILKMYLKNILEIPF